MKPKVFISHTSRETGLAQALQKHLAAVFGNCFEVFVSSDGKTIRAGTEWLKALTTALEEAKLEIVLCSEESVERPWVNFEAGAGWARRIRVIPLCHSGMTAAQLPLPLNMLQALEAGQSRDLQIVYEAVAESLGVSLPPAVDFKVMACEIRELENKYQQSAHDVERIEQPRILCAASEQYANDMDFELDVAILERKFPQQVVVERQLTSVRLRDLLASQSFAIIHLVVAVDKEDGDLFFSPVGSGHKPTTSRIDRMPAEGFARLLGKSKTRLVVLATCSALYLAVEVSRMANMIATQIAVKGEQMADWSEWFYDLLAKGYSLFESYEDTKENKSLPMKLVRHRDVAFSFEGEKPPNPGESRLEGRTRTA